jgi:hypothetical protein
MLLLILKVLLLAVLAFAWSRHRLCRDERFYPNLVTGEAMKKFLLLLLIAGTAHAQLVQDVKQRNYNIGTGGSPTLVVTPFIVKLSSDYVGPTNTPTYTPTWNATTTPTQPATPTVTTSPTPLFVHSVDTPVPYPTDIPNKTVYDSAVSTLVSAGNALLTIANTFNQAMTVSLNTLATNNVSSKAATIDTAHVSITSALPAGSNALGGVSILAPVTVTAHAVTSYAGGPITLGGTIPTHGVSLVGIDTSVTLATSGTNSSTVTFGDFTFSQNCRGLGVVVDVTTVTGSGIFTFALDNKDQLSGKYINVGTSANVSTVSTNQYRFYPGITSVANVDFNAFVAPTYRIRATLISGTSQVFSIGGWTIP